MFLHPGVMALVSGAAITLSLLLAAVFFGARIIRRWNPESNSEEQLDLERRTYLVSTLVKYALFFDVLSTLLFVYTADDIHNLLVGAMCATGSLNANGYGFPALFARIGTLLLSSLWLAVNQVDSKAEDYPLTKFKYLLLMAVFPASAAAFGLQILYFLGIDPNVITSCCGTLFSQGGSGAASDLASLPVRKMEIAFYADAAAVVCFGVLLIKRGKKIHARLLSASSLIFFFVGPASVISFVSPYFYQLPTHHCPFDILQREYLYAGYPLYASLFCACFFGLMTGLIEPFGRHSSLASVIPAARKNWARISVFSMLIFVAICSYPMLFLPFRLEQ